MFTFYYCIKIEQDEGDGESRDVDAAPPAAPLPPPPAVIQRAPPPPPFQQPPRRQQQQQQNPPPARIPGNPYASQGSRDASNRIHCRSQLALLGRRKTRRVKRLAFIPRKWGIPSQCRLQNYWRLSHEYRRIHKSIVNMNPKYL